MFRIMVGAKEGRRRWYFPVNDKRVLPLLPLKPDLCFVKSKHRVVTEGRVLGALI